MHAESDFTVMKGFIKIYVEKTLMLRLLQIMQ